MKKAYREKFEELTKVTIPAGMKPDAPDWMPAFLELCFLCKYAEYSGSCCSGDGDMECKHPIEKIADFYASDCGNHCWGFNNVYSYDDCIRILETLLLGKVPDVYRIIERGIKR